MPTNVNKHTKLLHVKNFSTLFRASQGLGLLAHGTNTLFGPLNAHLTLGLQTSDLWPLTACRSTTRSPARPPRVASGPRGSPGQSPGSGAAGGHSQAALSPQPSECGSPAWLPCRCGSQATPRSVTAASDYPNSHQELTQQP